MASTQKTTCPVLMSSSAAQVDATATSSGSELESPNLQIALLMAEVARLHRELQLIRDGRVGAALGGAEIRHARKARGWSVPRLIYAMTEAADREGVRLMSNASLKTSISRWENGRCRPDELHSRLLEQVLGRPLLA
ncbi:hypothetical protein ACFXHA_43085 [Nocardia sp. NPDC059240]|uniref:hypothetical protein n=1 Tax=Nocardia sp. NPDC059240 TaxID=3346786 RepID=UPI003682EDD7